METTENIYLSGDTRLQGGRFKIVRFIGSGGFGCTYEGEHTMLGSRVAIKEFFVRDFCNRDEVTSYVTVGTTEKTELVEKLKRKFLEEARFTAGMHHPNIARVSDVFEENGTAYYVMDYIDGPSLEKLVREKGPIPEQTALKYIRQIADALSYVHSLNRLHLDLKPGNIMTDGRGNAILIDFGASKQYDEVGGENTSTLIGKTPGYAPIEQMGNNVVTFTPATDIYALGATLYKLLTGVTPPDATLLASGEDLPPLPRNISEGTANAVYAAMQVAKSKRPQSIAEFLSLLEGPAVESNKSVGAPVISTPPTSPAPPTPVVPAPGEGETIIDSPVKTEPPYLPQPQPTPEEKNLATITGQIDGHEYVDLGLSVKWATCNVGAKAPSDYGNYYAWGETKSKEEYKGENSVTYGRKVVCIAGDSEYDAARANWGGTWRMPTLDEIDELINRCKFRRVYLGGHDGYEVTGPNGNSIFLPFSGRQRGVESNHRGEVGYYWSASPHEKHIDRSNALEISMMDGELMNVSRELIGRRCGGSVRPVSGGDTQSIGNNPTNKSPLPPARRNVIGIVGFVLSLCVSLLYFFVHLYSPKLWAILSISSLLCSIIGVSNWHIRPFRRGYALCGFILAIHASVWVCFDLIWVWQHLSY